MPEPEKMQCGEFEALLGDALDEKLTGQGLGGFQAHARSCQACGPLMSDADDGRRWLKSLAEVDPPEQLVSNILLATSRANTLGIRGNTTQVPISWVDRLLQWTGGFLLPVTDIAKQPRFAMSFGMVFFALSVSLSLAGVKLGDLRHVNLRPSAVRRTYFETSGRMVKYYENIRFVYEIESRVREFKKATAPAESEPPKKDNRHTNDTSQEPERRQERNYSQGESGFLLASAPGAAPVKILANACGRFS